MAMLGFGRGVTVLDREDGKYIAKYTLRNHTYDVCDASGEVAVFDSFFDAMTAAIHARNESSTEPQQRRTTMADGMQKLDKPSEKTGLDLLREPFPPHQISKLPKPTAAQTKAVKDNFKEGIRCQICGSWHHPKVVHLDYVGHAALTDRLLDCDPNWNWEPVSLDENGAPRLDNNGGMWIRLTVCGQTRLGYGHADAKKGGDAIKEVIGDALRNAAMRFGAALDLWHKGDLHKIDGPTGEEERPDEPDAPEHDHTPIFNRLKAAIENAETLDKLKALWSHKATASVVADLPSDMSRELRKLHKEREEALTPAPFEEFDADDIPFD